MNLRPFRDQDRTMISVLLTTAYERPTESQLVEAMRASGDMALELVAEDAGKVIGHLAFARLVEPQGWWALAPLSVIRSRQNQGIGSEILRYGLDLARQAGSRAVAAVGPPSFYKRFGFSREAADRLSTAYPRDYVLVYPIKPGSAGHEGALIYPESFVMV
ncbi:GNAT family N-acetyltransferase [Frigidibacter sp. MR17.24]|uniref:GNAT family N-acetyltransferase n=1 Tax=Frigidibacter sp. MR17.24 TaxID=3127345 RepID=UPI003012C0B4